MHQTTAAVGRLWRATRRWQRLVLVGLLLTGAVFGALVIGLRIAEAKVRAKAVQTLESKLGRDVTIDGVDLGLGSITLRGLEVAGNGEDEMATLTIERATLAVQTKSLFAGPIRVDSINLKKVRANIDRASDGSLSIDDVVERLTQRVGPDEDRVKRSARFRLPARFGFEDAELSISDSETGTTVVGAESGWLGRGQPGLSFAIENARATVEHAHLATLADSNRGIHVAGTIGAKGDALDIDLTASYGKNRDAGWKAVGSLERDRADLDLEFDQTSVARGGSLLRRLHIEDHARATVDGKLALLISRSAVIATGDVRVTNFAVDHPVVASRPVRDIRGRTSFVLSWSREEGRVVVEPLQIWLGDDDDGPLIDGSIRGEVGGPATPRKLAVELAMAPTDCQAVLQGLPRDAMDVLQGFEIDGAMSASLKLHIDWADLESTRLESSVDLTGCRVGKAPERITAEALNASFDHRVPVGDGWTTYRLGPENPNYVPLAEVSKNLKRSILYTEDGGFYNHAGFSGEFRVALIRNLQEGRFAWGGSSLTNQMVKNVFLGREKTLIRKVQEFALTWHVEQILSKDRILEIYLNAIEFGPGLYGLRPAAQQYFSKEPNRLNTIESAFFSTLLPAPRVRYRQFCDGEASEWTERKVERIVDGMHRFRRLDDDQYLAALETRLVFRGDAEAAQMCKPKEIAAR